MLPEIQQLVRLAEFTTKRVEYLTENETDIQNKTGKLLSEKIFMSMLKSKLGNPSNYEIEEWFENSPISVSTYKRMRYEGKASEKTILMLSKELALSEEEESFLLLLYKHVPTFKNENGCSQE